MRAPEEPSVGNEDHEFDVRRIEKPWGHELVWALTDRYCGKILFVAAGEALSLQFHRRKDESWYVLEGSAQVELGGVGEEPAARVVGPGEALRLPAGTVHRVTALSDTRILEVSTPEIDDVVRIDDRYGRADGEEV
jgi:mannose-6-phosphate isomerase-like protein (cupin superfamily)